MTVQEERGTEEQEAYIEPGGRSVNADTDWQKIPECRLDGGMADIITRILGLRAKVGTRKQIFLQNMDVKSGFRQVELLRTRQRRSRISWGISYSSISDYSRVVPRVVGGGSERNTGTHRATT